MAFDIPVVIIIFNRPENLRLLWDQIRANRPSKLYVISDGPRTDEEKILVDNCRELATPDWECDVVRIFSERNLGCRKNQITGISQVFSAEEEVIVLEDDCVPSASFFDYCQFLLNQYRNDDSIFSITGLNQFAYNAHGERESQCSFSRYFSSWGWACWRRSWSLCNWSEKPGTAWLDGMDTSFAIPSTINFWKQLLSDENCFEKLDSWAYQFGFTALRHARKTIIPAHNLIGNNGLLAGTHNKRIDWQIPAVEELHVPFRLPQKITLDDEHDKLFERRHYDGRLISRLRAKLAIGTRIRKLLGRD